MKKSVMNKRFCLWLLAVSVAVGGFAQTAQVHIRKGIPYSTVQFPGQDKMEKLCFDFYEPMGSSESLRPLVITVFGGGFVLGSRDYEDMVAWCNRFAENGYAAASIDYRLMPAKKFSSKELIRTGYMAAQDVSAAVRFFKANSAEYRIDTNRDIVLIFHRHLRLSGYSFSIHGLPYAYGSVTMADRLRQLGTASFELHLQENEPHAFYFKHLYAFQLDALKFDNCFQTAVDFMGRCERGDRR